MIFFVGLALKFTKDCLDWRLTVWYVGHFAPFAIIPRSDKSAVFLMTEASDEDAQ